VDEGESRVELMEVGPWWLITRATAESGREKKQSLEEGKLNCRWRYTEKAEEPASGETHRFLSRATQHSAAQTSNSRVRRMADRRRRNRTKPTTRVNGLEGALARLAKGNGRTTLEISKHGSKREGMHWSSLLTCASLPVCVCAPLFIRGRC
jgi:hypothetical protein